MQELKLSVTLFNRILFSTIKKKTWASCSQSQSRLFSVGASGDKTVNLHQTTIPSSRINAPKFITRPVSNTDPLDLKRAKTTNKKMEKCETDDKIVWVDCEMTGLNIEKDFLMEVACIITDGKLEEIARQQPIVIRLPNDVLNGMNEWCMKHHGDSGLTAMCAASDITMEMADEILTAFVKKHTFPGVCPLAGNSNHMDRLFISHQMPEFNSHLHYRNIDVSTVKELVKRWFPDEFSKAPKKTYAHRVMSDIEESIAELKYYRSAVFVNSEKLTQAVLLNGEIVPSGSTKLSHERACSKKDKGGNV